ncbi:MAG: ABC transporter substrate-binding protein [Rubrobacter sp.]|jgi:ABC-type sugar transport system substrate-binding protein|nr:ABC transporter substrate-binding protein [Rubrobacter sp.]MDQ5809815.1 ABC transporter substrate-binding protein [Actinomycetota bacterium]
MTVARSKSLLMIVMGLLLLIAAACSPPGANPENQGVGSGGKEGKQRVQSGGNAAAGAGTCNVKPPDVTLEKATIGFSQMENNNPWRIAETESMKAEGEKRAGKYIATDAQADTSKQVSDVEDMIAQGVDILVIAPREFEGLAPALDAAAEANVPVFLVDREAKGEPCKEYITFIGSNFIKQGERAGEWLINATDGEAKIAELEGTTGASVTNDRAEGFRNAIQGESGMEIVASQSGDFTRAGGQKVMEQLIQANPDINAVYAHNDEMAIGAIQALKDAGKTPGEDVTLVSIDGTRDALQAIIDGELGATVESNPRFGPLTFETVEKFLAGEPIPQKIILEDRFFDKSNAEEFIDSAY